MIAKTEITCPTCNKAGTWTTENTYKPFCSERCKLIDLGEWASEGHKIPGEDADVEKPENPSEDDEHF